VLNFVSVSPNRTTLVVINQTHQWRMLRKSGLLAAHIHTARLSCGHFFRGRLQPSLLNACCFKHAETVEVGRRSAGAAPASRPRRRAVGRFCYCYFPKRRAQVQVVFPLSYAQIGRDAGGLWEACRALKILRGFNCSQRSWESAQSEAPKFGWPENLL